MTKEELKQKAEKHADSYATPDLEDSFRVYIYEANKDGYFAGATENGIQWHKVEEEPVDVRKEYLVAYAFNDNTKEYYSFDIGRYWHGWQTLTADGNGNNNGVKVIAWCEIPQFKE